MKENVAGNIVKCPEFTVLYVKQCESCGLEDSRLGIYINFRLTSREG